jgi:hypothetical protein
MISTSLLFASAALLLGRISRFSGLILLCGYVAYIGFLIAC